MGRIFFVILAVFLLLGAFAEPILDGVKTWRTNNTTQAFSVSTGAAQTTANVTLTYDLFQANIAEVILITSNATEVPIANSYVEATKILNVAALNPSETHTLTVNYYAETENAGLRAVGPFLGLLIIGGCIFVVFKGSKGK